MICLIDPKSVLSESLRSLRTNIQFASMDRRVKSILFTSAGLGEGKSTCVINLAITLAQEGQRVLLVDADLRRPIVHQRLGIDREPGLVDALLGSIPWRKSVRSATDLMLGTLGADRVMTTPGPRQPLRADERLSVGQSQRVHEPEQDQGAGLGDAGGIRRRAVRYAADPYPSPTPWR
ncbi:MAG: hypothetical protein KatS3mg082_0387 [Nitrospiraceae bacterium]|nr:MAG: hypothetical protein KatS3mg082_0387 [Nitrospiraceae bacterium]